MISCKESAIKLITFKDRTEKEMHKKLSEKGYEQAEIEEVIEFLKEYGYVNDLRFAERFAEDAVKIRKWGRMRIKSELTAKGIEREIAESVTESLAFDGKEAVISELSRRFKNSDFSNQKERMRIFSYFARRGYSPNEIRGAMNSVCSFDDIIGDYED